MISSSSFTVKFYHYIHVGFIEALFILFLGILILCLLEEKQAYFSYCIVWLIIIHNEENIFVFFSSNASTLWIPLFFFQLRILEFQGMELCNLLLIVFYVSYKV